MKLRVFLYWKEEFILFICYGIRTVEHGCMENDVIVDLFDTSK